MPTLLLVEDDEQNRDMLIHRLKRRDYDVEVALDGLEAVEKVAAVHPDLILMDIKLPEMDGLEATRRIRAAESEEASVPIIALTAHAFDEHEDKARSAGCDDYHVKPVHFTKLLEQMEALLKTS